MKGARAAIANACVNLVLVWWLGWFVVCGSPGCEYSITQAFSRDLVELLVIQASLHGRLRELSSP